MPMQQCPNCGCSLKRFAPFTYGNVGLDERGEITFEGRSIFLLKTQRSLVDALIQARGRGLTRSTLAGILEGEINDSTISKYVERARAAFRKVDPDFNQIESLRGFGAYRWVYRPSSRSSASRSRQWSSVSIEH